MKRLTNLLRVPEPYKRGFSGLLDAFERIAYVAIEEYEAKQGERDDSASHGLGSPIQTIFPSPYSFPPTVSRVLRWLLLPRTRRLSPSEEKLTARYTT